MSSSETPPIEGGHLPERVKFDYIKSNLFRVVRADGVIGGVTPRLAIHMSFFNERSPIPKQTVFRVREDGSLGTEIKEERVVRDAVVREVEVDVVMELNAAKSLIEWLRGKIESLETLQGTTEKAESV